MVGGDYCGRNEGLPLHQCKDNPMPVWMQMIHINKKCLTKRNGYCRTIQQNPDAFFRFYERIIKINIADWQLCFILILYQSIL